MKHILYTLLLFPAFLAAQSVPDSVLPGIQEQYQGVRDLEADPNMWIAPNPSADFLNIYLRDRAPGKITISVYNLLGKLLYEYIPLKQQSNLLHREDVSAWQPGTYLVRVSTDDRTLRTVRFVKR